MLRIHFRGFISILLSLAFLFVVATGLVLWLSHSPETFGIGKGVWKHCHIFLSLLMLIAGVVHFYLNWSVYWSYLWQRDAGRVHQKREIVLAVAILALVLGTSALDRREGTGADHRLFGMSLREIAEKSGKPLEQMVSTLTKEGVAVHDPGDSVMEIAKHNNMPPVAFLDVLRRAAPEVMRSVGGRH